MSGIHHRLGRNKAAIAFLFLALGAPVWIARGGEIALEPSGKLGVAENDISRFGPPARTQEAQSSAGFSSEEPRPIGHGDGKIWVIPSLSAPSVKNGGKLTISAVVKAPAGVREVRAEIRDGDRILDTLKLKASSAQMGGVGNLGGGKLRSANDELRNEERGERETSVEAGRAPSTKKPDGQANVRNAEISSGNSSFAIRHSEFGGPLPAVGLWTADWTAHDLDEKSYSVILRITDAQGHIFEDTSLQFSDPTAGITTTGTRDESGWKVRGKPAGVPKIRRY
ncbi:hypothetical protein HYR69_03030 [Candidatus Sumerlaeota bacterium]|nr:hypothetical protein [Candidatus Sumerlaeota bacterium]